MLRVPGIRPRLWQVIRAGQSVVVAWMRRGQGARQRPYVRGRVGVRVPLGCEVEGLHLFTGVDWSRTGRCTEAGRRPVSHARDEHWQTDLIGNASSEWPAGALCLGRLSGRPVGWISAAYGASSGATSNNSRQLVTCFDLVTGETIWQVTHSLAAAAGQNFAGLYLSPVDGELLIVQQNSIGVGTMILERISACTGELLAHTEAVQSEAENHLGWTILADGAGLVGYVPTRTAIPESLSRRLQVWARAPLQNESIGEAYARAYQLELPTGGDLVGSGPAGGAGAGWYWPDLDQAILIVEERQDGGTPPLVMRARVIAWELRTGRIMWSWQPHDKLGIPLLGRRVFGQLVQRDHETGDLYYTCRVDAASDLSYAAKIEARTGRTLWTQEIDAQGVNGKYFNGFSGGGGGQGMFAGSFLSHYTYNSAAMYEGVRPVLLDRSTGNITEGPLGWRLVAQIFGPDWALFGQSLDQTPDVFRLYLVDAGLTVRASWQYNVGLARASRTTPDAGPMAFWLSRIYGVNWDSAAGGWRVRRWG